MRPTSNFTYDNRRVYGSHSIDNITVLIKQNAEIATILQTSLGWFQLAHTNFIKALELLNKEIGEDEALTKLQLKLPTTTKDGIEFVYDTFELITRKAKLKKDQKALKKIRLSIEQVTGGKKKSELNSTNDKYVFIEHLHEQLPSHKELHYKDADFDLIQHVETLWKEVKGANKSLSNEKAETQEARRAVWKSAIIWDREYSTLKLITRGSLRHLQRSSETKEYFLDIGPTTSTSSSEPTENDENTETPS
ncbi:MAG TPA: hypothetical protein DCE42_20300 [Myxococcales bacterium]|nr:hypothetical protein [Deltaproteobacteria bacterium]MBU53135.1 hypothetical protein [Deltaproteobacteria bacterium]HAA57118.1 hypothetical protein [Myxococcales bacterium]|tara:strand:- start:9118 stop:9867 length:750 start_codon:yes stop_codon:yes gene_type:complete